MQAPPWRFRKLLDSILSIRIWCETHGISTKRFFMFWYQKKYRCFGIHCNTDQTMETGDSQTQWCSLRVAPYKCHRTHLKVTRYQFKKDWKYGSTFLYLLDIGQTFQNLIFLWFIFWLSVLPCINVLFHAFLWSIASGLKYDQFVYICNQFGRICNKIFCCVSRKNLGVVNPLFKNVSVITSLAC